jgi:hypothetical protein
MRRLITLLSIILIPFLISGALGLETQADCDQQYALTGQVSQQIECYHQAAVTMAYLGDPTQAEGLCQEIVSDFGTPGEYSADINQRAELEANDCYFDIAKILADNNVPGALALCSDIQDTTNSGLSGAATTQEMCNDEVGKAYQQSQPQPGSLCSVLFILPLVLVGAIAAAHRR